MQAVYEGRLLGTALGKESRREMLSCDMASARISAAPMGCSGVWMVLQLVQVGVRGVGFVPLYLLDIGCEHELR